MCNMAKGVNCMEMADRKKEIINDCLELLVAKGLISTSTRDLSKAMKLQSGGMYYYFPSKDDLILACVEEATFRMENSLILPAMEEILYPRIMMKRLQARALNMAPTMKFFVSVCTDKRYEESVKPVLARLGERYTKYSIRFAEILKCDPKDISPYVYLMITSVSNYMVFEEKSFVAPQLRAVQIKLERIIANSAEDLSI